MLFRSQAKLNKLYQDIRDKHPELSDAEVQKRANDKFKAEERAAGRGWMHKPDIQKIQPPVPVGKDKVFGDMDTSLKKIIQLQDAMKAVWEVALA